MPNRENVLPVLIDRTNEAITALISAPGAGKRIAIDKIVILAGGGANLVTLTGTIAVPFQLTSGQLLQIDNPTENYDGIFPCNDNQAFSLTQSAATRITGYVLYRILNG